ncbi:MAG: hypothetical protein JWM27_3087 [Gemmatimonadetes bacterium]|nr:hypothetical protein [Gemmatimonadota bacterium]
MRPLRLLPGGRPDFVHPNDRASWIAAVRADLAATDLNPAAATLGAVLAAGHQWVRGEEPGPIQRRGFRECLQLFDAVSCLKMFVRCPLNEDTRAEAMSECCAAAERLERHGACWTARAFLHLACCIDPGEPLNDVDMGRLFARTGDRETAWRWFLWAARAARQQRDHAALSGALFQMGELAGEEDQHALAARLLTLARWVARRGKCRDHEGEALVALGLLRHRLGWPDEALGHFHAAIEAFGTRSPLLAAMGLQVAEQWVAEGQFRAAYGMLVTLAEAPNVNRDERLAATAMLTRCAAALGRTWNYEAGWNATWRQLGSVSPEVEIHAVLQLGKAAATRKDWIRAQQAGFSIISLAASANDKLGLTMASRMVLLAAMPDNAGAEDLDRFFPDLAHLRSGLVADWNDDDEAEPWDPNFDVRSLIQAFRVAASEDVPDDPHALA